MLNEKEKVIKEYEELANIFYEMFESGMKNKKSLEECVNHLEIWCKALGAIILHIDGFTKNEYFLDSLIKAIEKVKNKLKIRNENAH